MRILGRFTALTLLACLASTAAAQNPAPMALADGKLQLSPASTWVRKQPSTNIVEHEYAVPKSQGDAADGRLTVMSAGGGVDANIDRWIAQFAQPDGSSTKDRTKIKKMTVAGEEVHLVDIAGTYKDQAGPMAPAVDRPKYRMLAAIIATKSQGSYFVKLYGPEKTVADHEKEFVTMIEGLQKK